MPDQTTLTGDMARVAADLLDELALIGVVPHGVHLYADRVSLTYLDAADRRLAANALEMSGPEWRHDGSSRVVHTGVTGTDWIALEVTSGSDAEDFRRLAEDNETAARTRAAAVKAGA